MELIEDILSGKEEERINNRPQKWDHALQKSSDTIVLVEKFKKSGTIAVCQYTDYEGRRVMTDIPVEKLIKIRITEGQSVSYRIGRKKDRLMKVKFIYKGNARCYWLSKGKILSESIPIEELRWRNRHEFEVGDEVEPIAEQRIDKGIFKRISAICEYHLYVTCIDSVDDNLDSFSPPTLYYFEDLKKY